MHITEDNNLIFTELLDQIFAIIDSWMQDF